jgi:tetratricopeptide (TPR) repeat protein
MRCRSALGLAVTLALAWAPQALAAGEGSPVGEGEGEGEGELDEPQRKAAAKAEVQAAGAAFSAGDYQAAIDHYQAAIELLPAPKLHYNIGVCHQRLALAAASSEQRTRERDLAIESYNRYLEQNPRAEDRLDVAETIRELGGAPVTMPALKPLFDDASTPSEPAEDQPWDGLEGEGVAPDLEPPELPESPEPPKPRERPYPSHGRFGVHLLGGFSPTMRAAAAVDAPGMVALDLHAGGFLGPRRRFLLAAQTMVFSGATLRTDGFSFYGYSLGLSGQQTWVLGREAVMLGFGGLVALTGQGLNQRANVPPPLCSLGRGAQIASRTGGLFAPRFDLGILLGERRRGMIGLLVQPSFAVFGDGPIGDQCGAGQTPWTVLGVRQRWQFQLWAGLGYGLRF